MTIHTWKAKGKGGFNHDVCSYDFFIKDHCVSCGWSFSEIEERKNIETLDDYKAFFKKYTKKNWNQQGVHQLFDNVKRGDFIWVRCGGVYYVAKVSQSPRELFCFDISKEATDYDCSAKLANIDWKIVGKEDAAPGSVSTYTHNIGAFIRVDANEEKLEDLPYTATSYYSAIRFGAISPREKKRLKRGALFNLIGYAAAEDLVALWLYDKFNYVVIPSTNKIGTQKYEFVLVDASKKHGIYKNRRIYIQVKNGLVSLESKNYTIPLLNNVNEELWLVTTSGSIDGDNNKQIVRYNFNGSNKYIEKSYDINELLEFAFNSQNINILPNSISRFLKYFK